jgi:hypothetical protein
MTAPTTTIFKIKLSHIKGILNTFAGLDNGIAVGTRTSIFSDQEQLMCMHINSDYQPVFWIAVATWYCEMEHLYLSEVPDWTPLDLASDCNMDDFHNLSFPHFVLLTED